MAAEAAGCVERRWRPWTRYVKVKTLDEATGPEMDAWIKQAARVPGWK